MVRWKGYSLEYDKWVKHSDVFAKDAIDTYYRRYPNAPCWITSAAFDSLSFWRRDRTIRFKARKELTWQEEGLQEFTAAQEAEAPAWKEAVDAFEAGATTDNPYQLPHAGK
jgi:hypothetical protein